MNESRTTNRYPVKLSVTITFQDESRETSIINLSVGGALFTGFGRLPIGTQLALAFKVPTSEIEIKAKAVVRWSTENSTGVQFDGLRAREVWSINEYFKEKD